MDQTARTIFGRKLSPNAPAALLFLAVAAAGAGMLVYYGGALAFGPRHPAGVEGRAAISRAQTVGPMQAVPPARTPAPPPGGEALVGTGMFRVDLSKALDTLQRFQLADPTAFLLPWLRAP